MRVYVPYSYASAPRASMLIGWLGHKKRKFGLPVAHTVLPVCWGGREAKEVNGAERQACSSPRWQPLRRQSKLCFLESSLLINILLLQNFKLVFFKCAEYLNTLKACMYFLLVPILLVPCLLRPSCQTARPLSSLVRLLAHPVGWWVCSHSFRLLQWKWTTLCTFFVYAVPETEARGLSVLLVRQSLLLTWNSLSWLVWFEFLLSSGLLLCLPWSELQKYSAVCLAFWFFHEGQTRIPTLTWQSLYQRGCLCSYNILESCDTAL